MWWNGEMVKRICGVNPWYVPITQRNYVSMNNKTVLKSKSGSST